ncbi:hypothetical protein BJX96DRAFT_145543 [Aspergillus floccosus]
MGLAQMPVVSILLGRGCLFPEGLALGFLLGLAPPCPSDTKIRHAFPFARPAGHASRWWRITPILVDPRRWVFDLLEISQMKPRHPDFEETIGSLNRPLPYLRFTCHLELQGHWHSRESQSVNLIRPEVMRARYQKSRSDAHLSASGEQKPLGSSWGLSQDSLAGNHCFISPYVMRPFRFGALSIRPRPSV